MPTSRRRLKTSWTSNTAIRRSTFVNSLLIYNNTEGSVGLKNVWELTKPRKDKVFFKDPTNETVNINFLIMLTSPSGNEKFEKAYGRLLRQSLKRASLNCRYEWIAGFLGNVNYTFTSASKMATASLPARRATWVCSCSPSCARWTKPTAAS